MLQAIRCLEILFCMVKVRLPSHILSSSILGIVQGKFSTELQEVSIEFHSYRVMCELTVSSSHEIDPASYDLSAHQYHFHSSASTMPTKRTHAYACIQKGR